MKTLTELSDSELVQYLNLLKDCKNINSSRLSDTREIGYSTKFAYHIVRLVSEVEQILTEGDLDITLNREQLKSIRRGEWTEQDIRRWFEDKEKALGKLYLESKLQNKPDEGLIKELLLNCLEHHYGNLSDCVEIPDKASICLRQIRALLDESGF